MVTYVYIPFISHIYIHSIYNVMEYINGHLQYNLGKAEWFTMSISHVYIHVIYKSI